MEQALDLSFDRLLMMMLSSLSCTRVSTLLFRRVVLIFFVDLGGGGEQPDVC